MSIMGNVAGLGAVQPDWAQTNEKSADFIRNKPDMTGLAADMEEVWALAEGALPRSGGTMSGAIAMGGRKITGLGDPADPGDAASKSYVDSKRITGTCTLTASGWTNGTQTKTSSRVYGTDMPHWGIVYGENREAEKEAFALVDELESRDGAFVFRCFGEVPKVDLNIQWEVDR